MAGMSHAEIRTFVRQLKREVINRQDPGAADRFFTADFVTHGVVPGRKPGLPDLKASFSDFFQAFPDAHETVKENVLSS